MRARSKRAFLCSGVLGALIAGTGVFATGCVPVAGGPAGDGASSGESTTAEAPDRAYHRGASFWQAVALRDAVIAGDIVRARREAALFEKARFPLLPDTWRYSVAQMQGSAREVAYSGDIDSAAQWTATIAVACGNCHRYSGEVPEFDAEPPPEPAPDQETLDERMKRHARVSEDLWLGLLGSEPAWKRGANTLNEAPPEPTAAAAQSVDEAFALELNQIKALGIQALMARTLERRAAVYGDLIARCAHCHPFARPEPAPAASP